MSNIVKLPFRTHSHVLKLLGDELYRNDRLAVFELVKNAYDADATEVTIRLEDFDTDEPSIVVEDNGNGMNLDTLKNAWLELGSGFKRESEKRFSPKFQRRYLGEKGVGRFAAHKLANSICLETRGKDKPEYCVLVDWPDLLKNEKYLGDIEVEIIRRKKPKVFKSSHHGTRIILTDLCNKNWTRGDVRRLKRLVSTLVSPFKLLSFEFEGTKEKFQALGTEFQVHLLVPGREEWLEDVIEVQTILDRAICYYKFQLIDGIFQWEYQFNPPVIGQRLKRRIGKVKKEDKYLKLIRGDEHENRKYKNKIIMIPEYQKGIGPIRGEFYVYDLRNEILDILAGTKVLKDYLSEQTGMRIYRDGIRVYN